MGISLELSGIKVGEDKCFLVNLNADPALNELLVYYLKVSVLEVSCVPVRCVSDLTCPIPTLMSEGEVLPLPFSLRFVFLSRLVVFGPSSHQTRPFQHKSLARTGPLIPWKTCYPPSGV